MKIRPAAVAGKFYPGNGMEISKQLESILKKESGMIRTELSEHRIRGAVVPHAGYMFSAYQAVHFFEILRLSKEKFDTFVIVNPNHTGYGPELALEENEYWETPLGKVEIDRVLHGFLNIPESSEAHLHEHSGEVILPMLQHFIDYPFKILPITMFRQSPENAIKIASSIYEANTHLKKRICFIASSDFSHFVEPEEGKRLDAFVINKILDYNTTGVFKEVHEKHISVCGFGPIMALMEFHKLISENPKNTLLKMGNSGDVMKSGEVVDYVSMLFYD